MPKLRPVLIGVVAIAVFGGAFAFFLLQKPAPPALVPNEPPAVAPTPAETINHTTIGTSVEGRSIEVFTFGTGDTHLLFVGGMHGGYEWNSVVLAEEFIGGLTTKEIAVPEGIRVSVIPNLNPDGVYKVLGMTSGFSAEEAEAIAPEAVAAGRFNANGVDLNRNFDCKWAPQSTWRGQVVSAGTAPFSEPEAKTLRDYVLQATPQAVIFWHSQANTVYASECHAGVLPDTRTLMQTYATAANYGAVEAFDAYPITGDAEGWLASLGIPAITVELQTRNSSEWSRNLSGITATLDLYEARLAR